MKNILNTWKGSFLATLIIIVFSLLNMFFNFLAVEYISFLGTAIALLFILVNLVFLLIKRKWRYALASFIILFVSIVFLTIYSFSMFWVYQSRPDKFADNLKIPENIDINIPQSLFLVEESRDSIMKNKIDFDLYASFQPGLYEYDFWVDKIDSGIIYLKAFEVTQEYRLSEEDLIEKSLIHVYNPTDSIARFGTTKHFTIYEGDWGKPYAARFELWYKSENSDTEKKILEKVYKIEGWQR